MKKLNFAPVLNENKVLLLPYTNPIYTQRLMIFLSGRGQIKMSVSMQLDYMEIRFEKAAGSGNFYEKLIPFLQITQDYETA
jgi:hypothetical protein